jgi:hypothetical protein
MKLDEEKLLSILQYRAEKAGEFTWGELADMRAAAIRDYYRLPYGNEDDGSSQFVSSEVHDTINTLLPDLLEVFTSGEDVVSLTPRGAEDVKNAENVGIGLNYIFYQQNDGFLVLHNAIKDALMVKAGAVTWYLHEAEIVEVIPYVNVSQDQIAYIQSGMKDAEIEMLEQTPNAEMEVNPESGEAVQLFSVRIKKTTRTKRVKVESFPPEELLVAERHASPMLHDSPYTARVRSITLSDLIEMGYEITGDELRSDSGMNESADKYERQLSNRNIQDEDADPDESMTVGDFYEEYARIDVDGDGIAELLKVCRVRNKILSQEVVSHVPFAICSPYITPHQWIGESVHDQLEDLQRLGTDIMRPTLDGLNQSVNPRTIVQTDNDWTPLVNLDDLLVKQVGGVVRTKDINAVREERTTFAGAAGLQTLEYVQTLTESRSGVNRYDQGMNSNSLNKTLGGMQMLSGASSKKRTLVARIIAECLVKPIFKGILKLATESGNLDKLSMRMFGESITLDPNEWHEGYDMTINVGLGTGDKQVQVNGLMQIMAMQKEAMAGGSGLVTEEKIYNAATKLITLLGYKNHQDFLVNPTTAPPKPPPPPPIELQVQQAKSQAEQEKLKLSAQLETQKGVPDMARPQHELNHEFNMEAMRQKAETDRAVAVENIRAQSSFATNNPLAVPESPMNAMIAAVTQGQMALAEAITLFAQNQARTADLIEQQIQASLAPKSVSMPGADGKIRTAIIQPQLQ